MPSLTLLVKSGPLNFQEHRSSWLPITVPVSLTFHRRMQERFPGCFKLTNRVTTSFTLVGRSRDFTL